MTPTPMPNRLAVRIGEAAQLCGMQKSWFYSALRRGEIPIPVIKLGKVSVLRVVDIERWLADQAEQVS